MKDTGLRHVPLECMKNPFLTAQLK